MLRLGEEVIIFDGGLGSEIEKLGDRKSTRLNSSHMA